MLSVKVNDHVNIRGSATLKAHIRTKTPLAYLVGSGASHIELDDDLQVQDFSLSLTGASHFTGTIYANSITTLLSGASNATLEGSSATFSSIATGASLLSDYGMTSQDVDLDLSGASQANLTVIENIDLKASGASVFRYKGAATVSRQELSGESQIVKVD